jgi:hypothetical protein
VKKLVIAGLCSAAVGVIGPLPAAQAETEADRCTTKSEYRQVKRGMTKAQVAKIIGYSGKKFFDFDPYETREYASCTHETGFVWVSYEHRKVTSKSANWR